jgi:hypothetical protein
MAWYNSGKDLTSSLFGNRDDSGILGTGQYRANKTQIDEKAFTDETRSNQRRKELAAQMQQFNGRSAPMIQGVKLDQNQSNQSRGYQDSLAKSLQARVNGTGGPSLAEMQQRQGLNQSLSNTLAQAASQRGVNPALALRMSQQTNSAAQQNAAFQGGMLRAQEQQAAEAQLGGLSTNMRGQDLDAATTSARLGMDTQLANQQSALANRGMNDAQVSQIRQQQLGIDDADRQAKMDLGKLRVNEGVGIAGVNAGAYGDAAARRANAIGGVAGGIAAMFSDKNLKTDINPAFMSSSTGGKHEGSRKMGEGIGMGLGSIAKSIMGAGAGTAAGIGAAGMIGSDEKLKTDISPGRAKNIADSIKGYTYRYKDPEKFGEGQQIGVMAQDLEKTPEGAQLVTDTPEGKLVDYNKAGPILMATTAMLNDRVSGLEKALKMKKAKGAA